MGWLIREPALLPREQVLWRRNANREQTALRQVGGRPFLTDQRLLFVPHRVDEATGGGEWCCRLAEVSAVTVEPARLAALWFGLTAKLRRRLRVEVATGDVKFVINRVEDAVERLQHAIGSAKNRAA